MRLCERRRAYAHDAAITQGSRGQGGWVGEASQQNGGDQGGMGRVRRRLSFPGQRGVQQHVHHHPDEVDEVQRREDPMMMLEDPMMLVGRPSLKVRTQHATLRQCSIHCRL